MSKQYYVTNAIGTVIGSFTTYADAEAEVKSLRRIGIRASILVHVGFTR